MESSAIDPVAFRDTQQDSWDHTAAGWKKWSEWWDRYASNVSERLVELAGVEPGSHVLDVAAGYGEPALTAARKAAPDGRVVATDISAEMLAFGRDRAADAGVGNIEFMHKAASSLDFPHESFDAAVSRWGIIFEPDGEGTAGTIRGFLKPGARFAISSWGPPERSPMLGLPMKAALDFLNEEPPPPGTPGPLSRPTPEAIAAILEGGGFSDVETDEMELTAEWSSPEEFGVYIKDIVAPIARMVEAHPQDVQEEAWAKIADSVRDRAEDDGTVRLSNQVLFAVGSA
jgi:ubiquinone/menaquinone biosynthesis C-methylase UbiE